MRRSFLLSRRIHHHAHHGHRPHPRRRSHHRRRPSTRRHPRYHRSQKQKRHTRKLRGGNEDNAVIDNTIIGTKFGMPYTNKGLMTNSNGVTQFIKNKQSPLNNSGTAQQLADLDI